MVLQKEKGIDKQECLGVTGLVEVSQLGRPQQALAG